MTLLKGRRERWMEPFHKASKRMVSQTMMTQVRGRGERGRVRLLTIKKETKKKNNTNTKQNKRQKHKKITIGISEHVIRLTSCEVERRRERARKPFPPKNETHIPTPPHTQRINQHQTPFSAFFASYSLRISVHCVTPVQLYQQFTQHGGFPSLQTRFSRRRQW